MNRTVNPEAAPYLDAVRARLSRMPDEEQEDLLADLEQHLSELVTNEAGPLFQQLGSAEEYAAELTHSAGWNDKPFADFSCFVCPIGRKESPLLA